MCKLRWLAFVHNSLFLCTYIFYVVGLTRNRALKQSAELLVLYCSSDWFIMSQSRMDVDPFYCLVHVLKLRFFMLVLVSYMRHSPESLSWFIYDTNILNAGARAVPNCADSSSEIGVLEACSASFRSRVRERDLPPLGRRRATQSGVAEGLTRGRGLGCGGGGPAKTEGISHPLQRQASVSPNQSGCGWSKERTAVDAARAQGMRWGGRTDGRKELLCSC